MYLFKNYWPLAVIIVLSLLFFYPVLFQNKIALPADALVGAHVPWTELQWEDYPAGVPIKNQEITDAFSQFYPWRSLVGKFWRAGAFPLWNPYMFSGTPFLATLHSAGLYPLNVIYLFLDDVRAWNFLLYLQILLSAVFMYLFLRVLQLSQNASLLGALAFAFSGYMIAWLEFATGGQAGLWLPLLLWLELKLLNTNNWQWIIPIAFVFFFVFTAGDFQVPVYVTLCYSFFGLYISRTRNDMLRLVVLLILGFIAGIFLSLPQLLPTFELFSSSIRKDDPYIAEYFYGILHWEKIVNFIWPDFFGNVVTRNYWGQFGYHEYLAFIGVIPLVFLVYSLLAAKMKYEFFFWIALLVSFLFLFPTPFAFLPFTFHIPALGTSSASRLIFFTDFCLATLAAFGFTKWEKTPQKSALKILFYFLLLTGFLFILLRLIAYYIQGIENQVSEIVTNLAVASKNLIPSVVVLLLLLVLLLAYSFIQKNMHTRLIRVIPVLVLVLFSIEILRFAWKNTPFSPQKFVFPITSITEYLENKEGRIAGGIPLNLFIPFSISSVEGYDSMYPQLNGEWFSLVNSGDLGSLSRRYGQVHNFNSPLLDYANMEYVVDYKKNIHGEIEEKGDYALGVTVPRYDSVFREGRIEVLKNNDSLPKVWLTTKYDVITDPSILMSELTHRDKSKKDVVFLDTGPQITVQSLPFDYILHNYSELPNKISFDLTTSEDALAFISESFDPGWRAYIDDKETQIQKGNFLFQVISVPKGEHSVRFIYDPQSFRMGLSLGIATLLLLMSLYLYNGKHKSIT